MREVFFDGLSVTARIRVRTFSDPKLKPHLTKFVQHADTLLGQQHGDVEELQIAPRRFRSKDRPRVGAVLSSSKRTDDTTIGIQNKLVEEKEFTVSQGKRTASSGQAKHGRL